MITVPETTERIILRSPYLTEALGKNLINLSALAREIQPEIEKLLIKDVSEASILMALKRLSRKIKPKFTYNSIFLSSPDMMVQSNLIEFTMSNGEGLRKKYQKLLEDYSEESKYFFTMTEGIFETNIIISRDLEKGIQDVLQNETILSKIPNLSSITIRLPKKNISTPGVYYFLLKPLAWEGINIVEVVSTPLEISIILDDKDVNRAFSLLKSLFK